MQTNATSRIGPLKTALAPRHLAGKHARRARRKAACVRSEMAQFDSTINRGGGEDKSTRPKPRFRPPQKPHVGHQETPP
jgi:hypothetical protein